MVNQVIETALSAARTLQSPQTNYIHHFYHKREEGVDDTIPIYENLLFALALLRSKNALYIQEARTHIQKLLSFEIEGQFPTYLHEYPQCHDPLLSAHLLPVFYWMLQEFYLVLGEELRQALTDTARRVLKRIGEVQTTLSIPFQLEIKIAAATIAFGKLWVDASLEKKGEESLESLRRETCEPDFGKWYAPEYLAETLVALQMIYQDIPHSPWSHFWTRLLQSWYQNAYCYSGPVVKERQWGKEPVYTLYDLFLGHFTGGHSYRVHAPHAIQLQGALVRNLTHPFPKISYPHEEKGVVAGHQWWVRQEESLCISALEKKGAINPSMQKGLHVLRIAWGDQNWTHTLVAQGESVTEATFTPISEGIRLYFLLAEDLDEATRRTEAHELIFFFDQQEGTEIRIAGEKATSFYLDQPIVVKTPILSLKILFSLVEGEGRFMGHLAPGNRPAQLKTKGKDRFTAFDWRLSLRTIRRNGPCWISAEIVQVPKDDNLNL